MISFDNDLIMYAKNNIYAKWVVIYIIPTNLSNIDGFILRQSMDIFIKNKFLSSQIYLVGEDCSWINNFIIEYGINKLSITNTESRLKIINDFLNDNKNIIYLSHCTIPKNSFFRFIKNNNFIVASFDSVDFSLAHGDNIYSLLGKKFGFSEIVGDDIMIIPGNPNNMRFISDAIIMARKLQTYPETAARIALTIGNTKTPQIKNINDLDIIDIVTPTTYNKILTSDPEESQFDNNMSYDNQNYIFYPYLDIDGQKQPVGPDESVFNTYGYGPKISQTKINLVPRYHDKYSGIFIKKSINVPIVPPLLHHVWLDKESAPIYQRAWAKVLHYPWTYLIWTENNIEPPQKWKPLWEKIHDPQLRYIIAAMIILDKYGGFIVDSLSVPRKIIPEEVLTNKFMIGYHNEATHGTALSFKVMAGIQNPPILNKIYSILATYKPNEARNKIDLISNEIRNDPHTMIYPSYYFNPSLITTPKILLNNTICITLDKIPERKETRKTPLQRNYEVTPDAIVAKLNENPRDRLEFFN